MAVIREKDGVLEKKENLMLVKKSGKKGSLISKHNHPDYDILFTVVKGEVIAHIEGIGDFNLIPGKVLSFDGINHISADLLEDSEIFITLIKK